MDAFDATKEFLESKAASDAQLAALEREQGRSVGLGPGDLLRESDLHNDPDSIPIPPEFAEKEPGEIVKDLQGLVVQESVFANGKRVWDDAGYNDIGYRTQFGIAPAVQWQRAEIQPNPDYSGDDREVIKIREYIAKGYYDDKPDEKAKQEARAAELEAHLPKYKVTERWNGESDAVITHPSRDFEAVIEYARQQLTDQQKSAYYGSMSEVVKNLAARMMVEGAMDRPGMGRHKYASLEDAEVGVAAELLRDGEFGMHGFGMGGEFGGAGNSKGGEAQSLEAVREQLISRLSERYAAHQFIAQVVFDKEVTMPLTDLRELAMIRRDAPSFLESDSTVTGGRVGALVELRNPAGVSNMLAAMERISHAKRMVFLHRLMTTKPEMRLSKDLLDIQMGGGYGTFAMRTAGFEDILKGGSQWEHGGRDILAKHHLDEQLRLYGREVGFALSMEQGVKHNLSYPDLHHDVE